MKKFIFLLAAAALLGAGCEDSSDADRVIPVSAIALDSSLSGGIVLEVGQTTSIAGKATVLPENATDKTEYYESSDDSIVSVDETGLVEALEPGLAMITVSAGRKHSHFEVRVAARKIPVETVTLPDFLAEGVALKVGGSLDIAGQAIVAPSNATDRSESYSSSNPMIADVSAEGVVTAIAVGEATISVIVDGVAARFTLTVEKIDVESVVLPEDLVRGVALEVGESFSIAGRAEVLPENATERAESYASSDERVATVSAEGVVTACGIGTTTITVTVDGVSASFLLTGSQYVPVTSVTLPEEWRQGVSLEVGQTLDIARKATVMPENATNRTESYASSDEGVAEVSAEGVVTALAAGQTTVSVTVDGQKADLLLTVVPVPVALEKIEIEGGANATQGTASVVLSQTATFDLASRLKLSPADQNEGVKYVAYGSEDIATIDENGIVTCKGVGTVTFVILAKSNTNNDFKNAGAKKAYFAVEITDPNDLDRTGWTMTASGKISGTAGSATSAFDGRFDPNVFGTPLGSNFGLDKPGKNGAGSSIWFVVDMKQSQRVNYVRLKHQSCRNTDRGCRWLGFSEILGSDTGEEGSWTTVATDVRFPDWAMAYAQGVDPNDGGTRNIDHYRDTPNMALPQTVNYRYLKFVGKSSDFPTNNSTCQFAELYLGLDE